MAAGREDLRSDAGAGRRQPQLHGDAAGGLFQLGSCEPLRGDRGRQDVFI